MSDSFDSMDCRPPSSSVHGLSQAIILDWVAISSIRDLPQSGIELESPALTGGFFTTEPPGKPWLMNSKSQFEGGFADSQCSRNVCQFINFGHFVSLAISIFLSARQLDHT